MKNIRSKMYLSKNLARILLLVFIIGNTLNGLEAQSANNHEFLLNVNSKEEKEEKIQKGSSYQFSIFFSGNKTDVFYLPKLNDVSPTYSLDQDGRRYYTHPGDRTFSIELGIHKTIRKYFLAGGFLEYGSLSVRHSGYREVLNGRSILYESLEAYPKIFNIGLDLKYKYKFLFIGVRGGVRIQKYGAHFRIIPEDQLTQVVEFNSINLGVGVYPLLSTNLGFKLRLSDLVDVAFRGGIYFNSDRILKNGYTINYINTQASLGFTYKLYQ